MSIVFSELAQKCVGVLRELTTDDAYERYLQHHGLRHPNQKPLNRREFYLQQQQEKWNGVKRCC